MGETSPISVARRRRKTVFPKRKWSADSAGGWRRQSSYIVTATRINGFFTGQWYPEWVEILTGRI
jgi:hypothetical protein